MAQDGVAVWLGIDWADEKHSWAMRIDGETRIHRGELNIPQRRSSRLFPVWRFGSWPAGCCGTGTEPRGADIHARQVCASGSVSDPPKHRGSLSYERVSIRRLERPRVMQG